MSTCPKQIILILIKTKQNAPLLVNRSKSIFFKRGVFVYYHGSQNQVQLIAGISATGHFPTFSMSAQLFHWSSPACATGHSEVAISVHWPVVIYCQSCWEKVFAAAFCKNLGNSCVGQGGHILNNSRLSSNRKI